MRGQWLRDSVSSVRAGFSDLDPGHLDIKHAGKSLGFHPKAGADRNACIEPLLYELYSMDDLPLAASNSHAEYPTCSAAGPRPQQIGPRGGVCRCEASGA